MQAVTPSECYSLESPQIIISFNERTVAYSNAVRCNHIDGSKSDGMKNSNAQQYGMTCISRPNEQVPCVNNIERHLGSNHWKPVFTNINYGCPSAIIATNKNNIEIL